MNTTLRWILGAAGTLLIVGTPYLWTASQPLFWLSIILICAWAFWLMMEYLRWAKTLGKK